MAKKQIYKNKQSTSFKWAACFLLFVFLFANVAIYYTNIRTFSKQQTHQTNNQDLPIYEALAEEDALNFDISFSNFLLSHNFKTWVRATFITVYTHYLYKYIHTQTLPIFLRVRVLRL